MGVVRSMRPPHWNERMKFKVCYWTLGVAKTASADDVKKSYRELARKHYPDVSKAAVMFDCHQTGMPDSSSPMVRTKPVVRSTASSSSNFSVAARVRIAPLRVARLTAAHRWRSEALTITPESTSTFWMPMRGPNAPSPCVAPGWPGADSVEARDAYAAMAKAFPTFAPRQAATPNRQRLAATWM